MEPNGWGTEVVAWLLAAVSFVVVVWCWPRFARRSVAAVLGRAGLQALVVVLTVVAVGATLNQENGWYANWSDLGNDIVGGPPPKGVQTTYGAPAPAAGRDVVAGRSGRDGTGVKYAALRARTQEDLHLRTDPGPGGQYVHVTVPGPTGRPSKLLIWLPEQYTRAGEQRRTYPVIEAFHGVPGNPDDLHHPVGIGAMIGRMVSRHALAPAIVVAPDYTPGGLDTECADGRGMPMNRWISKDVPDWVTRHLRVRTDRQAWATIGYSAGGYCAGLVAMDHPERFGATMIMGGYFAPIFAGWNPFGADVPAKYDLLRMEREDPPDIAAWVQVAPQDLLSGRASATFARGARAPMSVTAMTWRRVGHRMSVWVDAMPDALRWLARTRAPFAGANAAQGTEHSTG